MKRKQTPQAKVCELERKLLMPWESFYPCTAGKFFVTREFASKWVGTTETSGPPNFFFVFSLVYTVLLFSFSHLHPPQPSFTPHKVGSGGHGQPISLAQPFLATTTFLPTEPTLSSQLICSPKKANTF